MTARLAAVLAALLACLSAAAGPIPVVTIAPPGDAGVGGVTVSALHPIVCPPAPGRFGGSFSGGTIFADFVAQKLIGGGSPERKVAVGYSTHAPTVIVVTGPGTFTFTTPATDHTLVGLNLMLGFGVYPEEGAGAVVDLLRDLLAARAALVTEYRAKRRGLAGKFSQRQEMIRSTRERTRGLQGVLKAMPGMRAGFEAGLAALERAASGIVGDLIELQVKIGALDAALVLVTATGTASSNDAVGVAEASFRRPGVFHPLDRVFVDPMVGEGPLASPFAFFAVVDVPARVTGPAPGAVPVEIEPGAPPLATVPSEARPTAVTYKSPPIFLVERRRGSGFTGDRILLAAQAVDEFPEDPGTRDIVAATAGPTGAQLVLRIFGDPCAAADEVVPGVLAPDPETLEDRPAHLGLFATLEPSLLIFFPFDSDRKVEVDDADDTTTDARSLDPWLMRTEGEAFSPRIAFSDDPEKPEAQFLIRSLNRVVMKAADDPSSTRDPFRGQVSQALTLLWLYDEESALEFLQSSLIVSKRGLISVPETDADLAVAETVKVRFHTTLTDAEISRLWRKHLIYPVGYLSEDADCAARVLYPGQDEFLTARRIEEDREAKVLHAVVPGIHGYVPSEGSFDQWFTFGPHEDGVYFFVPTAPSHLSRPDVYFVEFSPGENIRTSRVRKSTDKKDAGAVLGPDGFWWDVNLLLQKGVAVRLKTVTIKGETEPYTAPIWYDWVAVKKLQALPRAHGGITFITDEDTLAFIADELRGGLTHGIYIDDRAYRFILHRAQQEMGVLLKFTAVGTLIEIGRAVAEGEFGKAASLVAFQLSVRIALPWAGKVIAISAAGARGLVRKWWSGNAFKKVLEELKIPATTAINDLTPTQLKRIVVRMSGKASGVPKEVVQRLGELALVSVARGKGYTPLVMNGIPFAPKVHGFDQMFIQGTLKQEHIRAIVSAARGLPDDVILGAGFRDALIARHPGLRKTIDEMFASAKFIVGEAKGGTAKRHFIERDLLGGGKERFKQFDPDGKWTDDVTQRMIRGGSPFSADDRQVGILLRLVQQEGKLQGLFVRQNIKMGVVGTTTTFDLTFAAR